MTIGRLAKAAGIPAATIRFYDERLGLLRPAERSSGNYRLYRREAAERLTDGYSWSDLAAVMSLTRREREEMPNLLYAAWRAWRS